MYIASAPRGRVLFSFQALLRGFFSFWSNRIASNLWSPASNILKARKTALNFAKILTRVGRGPLGVGPRDRIPPWGTPPGGAAGLGADGPSGGNGWLLGRRAPRAGRRGGRLSPAACPGADGPSGRRGRPLGAAGNPRAAARPRRGRRLPPAAGGHTVPAKALGGLRRERRPVSAPAAPAARAKAAAPVASDGGAAGTPTGAARAAPGGGGVPLRGGPAPGGPTFPPCSMKKLHTRRQVYPRSRAARPAFFRADTAFSGRRRGKRRRFFLYSETAAFSGGNCDESVSHFGLERRT